VVQAHEAPYNLINPAALGDITHLYDYAHTQQLPNPSVFVNRISVFYTLKIPFPWNKISVVSFTPYVYSYRASGTHGRSPPSAGGGYPLHGELKQRSCAVMGLLSERVLCLTEELEQVCAGQARADQLIPIYLSNR